MSTPTTQLQQAPYLRAQRNFPNDDMKDLSKQIDQAYIDIANKVNLRTIGVFPVGFSAITGESWFLQGQPTRQQTLRRVYTFTTTAPINHGIDFAGVDIFTRMYGQYTDGTNWYGMPATTSVAIFGQFTFYVTPTQIIFPGLGAGAPAIQRGNIILEWLSKF